MRSPPEILVGADGFSTLDNPITNVCSASWMKSNKEWPANFKICSIESFAIPKVGTKRVRPMKYSFRLYPTGPKTKIKDNWDLSLNLQACPKCKALNHKIATLCSKCGHSLSEPSIPANNPVASTAPEVAPAAEHEELSQSKTATIQEQMPDASSPSIASNASRVAPTPAHPESDMPMLNRQFAMSNEQKWLRRIWGVLLLASVAIPFLIVVFSLQSPSAPPPATKNPGNNAGSSLAIPPPLESVPAAAEQKTLSVIPDQELAVTEPVVAPAATPLLPEPESRVPILAKQSAHAAPPRKARFTAKKIAQSTRKSSRIHDEKAAPVVSETPEAPLPRPREPVAPANTPCSEAARALALCNTNAN